MLHLVKIELFTKIKNNVFKYMEVFKVKYDGENGDLFGISIVDEPANGFDFIAMSKQREIKLSSDEKKKILYGIVLRPEQKIYREFEDGTPFQLMFDAPTIERFSQDFMKKGYQKNSTFNHDHDNWLEGTTVVENWIVMNKENDKANEIGLPVENGDWVIGMKLSDQLWSDYIETGKAKGFSIDSFIEFEKINMKKTCGDCLTQDKKESRENKSNNMSMLKKLIKLFSEEQVTLASLVTDLGTFTADAFEIGNIVYNENLEPVMDAEFVSENKVYKTDMTGTIVEISDVMEEVEDQMEEDLKKKGDVAMEDIEAEVVDAVTATTEEIVAEVAKPVEEVDVEALKAQIEALTAELEKITAQKDAVLMENVKLKNLATATKLKAEVKGQSPITMKAKETSTNSTLEALSRITKKINK